MKRRNLLAVAAAGVLAGLVGAGPAQADEVIKIGAR